MFWTVSHTSVVYLPQHGKESWACAYCLCWQSDNLVRQIALLMNFTQHDAGTWLPSGAHPFHGTAQCCSLYVF